MRAIWIVLGAALCGFVMAGTGVDPSARWVAGIVVLAGGVTLRARSLVVLGILLGIVSGLRLPAVPDPQLDPSAEVAMAVELTEAARDGRARGWARLPDGAIVRARVRGLDGDALAKGSRLLARARIQDLRRRSTPDRRDSGRAARARREGIGIVVREVLGSVPGGRASFVSASRSRWAAALDARLGASAGLWRALVLADGGALDPRSRATVQSVGMAHLLALSGLHTSIVAAAILLPLRRRGRRALAFAIPVLAAWVVLAGAGPSLVRAVGMACWWVLARRRGSRSAVEDSIAAVALVELTLRPHLLCGIGWWLSYVSTIAVVKAARRAGGWPRPVAAVWISMAAQLATLPWVIDGFGLVNVAAPLTLLVVGPVFAACLVGGFGALAVGGLCAPVAPWTDSLAIGCGHVFGLALKLVGVSASCAATGPGLDGTSWTVLLGIVAVAVWPVRFTRRARWSCIGMLALLGLSIRTPDHEWILFDVGQGDAGVLRCGPRALVIDTGPRYDGSAPVEWTVVDWLRRRRLEAVAVAITHGHADHDGGLARLLALPIVDEVVAARSDSNLAWLGRIRAACGSAGVPLRLVAAGDELDLGHCQVKVLWPPRDTGELHANDRSVVLSWEGPGGRILSSGDLERPGEGELLNDGVAGSHRWLKVAHHGGDTGTDAAWLEKLQVADALVSCGAGNRYGHPAPAVLGRLRDAGVRVHRTDECGFIRLSWSHPATEGRMDCGRNAGP